MLSFYCTFMIILVHAIVMICLFTIYLFISMCMYVIMRLYFMCMDWWLFNTINEINWIELKWIDTIAQRSLGDDDVDACKKFANAKEWSNCLLLSMLETKLSVGRILWLVYSQGLPY